ncbi:spore coat protein [Solibacillus isronensis]|uniref:spore coat protein n=1 Tax=Solibacillus isronensis TaxID=412383 RepID=UPI0009A5F10D|nr:spore coat protein [Solibacillus isronensis]
MPVTGNQNTEDNLEVIQTQNQGLLIQNSHTVDVTQTEVQGLVVVQAALQAAIEAAVVVLGSNENADVSNLQSIAQNLAVTQTETQNVTIIDSDAITVRQTEVQIDVVVQAAIQLLAQLALRVA